MRPYLKDKGREALKSPTLVLPEPNETPSSPLSDENKTAPSPSTLETSVAPESSEGKEDTEEPIPSLPEQNLTKPETIFYESKKLILYVRNQIKRQNLGSQLRKEVWVRDMFRLEQMASPSINVAVCGATGSGKSSLINAILEKNIVPTSGMRACTAVICEVAYHDKKHIEADISFLSLEEWRTELESLKIDLTDEGGHVLSPNDLEEKSSQAGIAWQKTRAIYPDLTARQMVKMSTDQIIQSNLEVTKLFGVTKKLTAKNTESFGRQIAKYVDSRDDEADGSDEQRWELWPIIRVVKIRCAAKALKTGAVLVDLPGVADANAARSQIAKDYMQKADFIWIVAPIQRAVNDRIAKDLLGSSFKQELILDGKYDHRTVTFIATRTDDVSCAEIIRALKLKNNSELMGIEQQLSQVPLDLAQLEKQSVKLDEEIDALEHEVESLGNRRTDLEDRLRAFRAGEPLPPLKILNGVNGISRKRKRAEPEPPPSKRLKSSPLADGDEDGKSDVDDNETDFGSDSDRIPGLDEPDEEPVPEESANSEMSEDSESEPSLDTEDAIQAVLHSTRTMLQEEKEHLKQLRAERKKCNKDLLNLRDKETSIQRDKNSFCSLRRSEYSRRMLKEDFREGIKQSSSAFLDDDPKSVLVLAELDTIDLPVFTCSSRDFMRIGKSQAKGDGGPSCFSNKEDTGIPGLQEWCHQLTMASRGHEAKKFLQLYEAFLDSIHSFFSNDEDTCLEERQMLRERWQTKREPSGKANLGHGVLAPEFWEITDDEVLTPLPSEDGIDPLEGSEEEMGISATLTKYYSGIAKSTVENLKAQFRNCLHHPLLNGASKAQATVLDTAENFAKAAHWTTYRSVLLRQGEWAEHDLNADFVAPMLRVIATPWARLFERDLFDFSYKEAAKATERLLKVVSSTAPLALRDPCVDQVDACLVDAQPVLQAVKKALRDLLQASQKNIHRAMRPRIQKELAGAYAEVAKVTGQGSTSKRKKVFKVELEKKHATMFQVVAADVLVRLDLVADEIGKKMTKQLSELADKLEVEMSSIWQDQTLNVKQLKSRRSAAKRISKMQASVKEWIKEYHRLEHDSHSEI